MAAQAPKSARNPHPQQYHLDGIEHKKELDHLLSTTDQWKVSSDTTFDFNLQGKSFSVRQLVSSSPDLKKKKNPSIWYIETICPGSPAIVSESFLDASYRKQWDPQVASLRQIQMGDEFPNICIYHSTSNALGGGLVSGREFVSLCTMHEFTNKATGCQSIQSVSKSVQREDIPEQKGLVRANVVLGGTLFEGLSDKEMEEMQLPKLMVSVNGEDNANAENTGNTKECEWTRVRSLLQLDLGGWIPFSAINSSMAKARDGSMRDLRNFVIQKRLGLQGTDD